MEQGVSLDEATGLGEGSVTTSVHTTGAILARFITTNAELKSLTVSRCALPPQAGLQIASALESAAANADNLRALDLSENKFNSEAGYALAAALRCSSRLVEFSCVGTPVDAATLAELRAAREHVAKKYS